MTTQYDPGIIYTFADRLYARAKSIATQYAIIAAFVGGIAGLALAGALDFARVPTALVGVLCFGGIGAAIGYDKSFNLRLTAQQALC